MNIEESVTPAPDNIVAARAQHRKNWEKSVQNAWEDLAPWQQAHCTNPDLLNMWWPETDGVIEVDEEATT
jgi:hypothetical protein